MSADAGHSENNSSDTKYDFIANGNIDPRGIGWVIYEKLLQNEDEVLLIDAATGEQQTRGSVLRRSITVATHIRDRGVTSEDIISICSSNNTECFLPVIAGYFLGIKVAPMDPLLPLNETSYLLKILRPKIIFCCDMGAKLIKQSMEKSGINTEIIVFGDTKEFTPFSEFLASNQNEEQFKPIVIKDVHDTCFINFTSGTTGLPKGVCLSDFAIQHQTPVYPMPFILLNYNRMYWVSCMLSLLRVIFGTAKMVTATFDAKLFCKYIQDYKVNMTFISPTTTHRITQHPECNIYDTSSLKLMYIIGAGLSEKQMLHLRNFFPHTIISQAYALTETSTAGIFFDPIKHIEFIKQKPTSCGFPGKGVICKLLDLDTNKEIHEPNYPGELWIKTVTKMNGYYDNPRATNEAYDKEGYLKTGDVFKIDTDGCYYALDRCKDMMKFQEWKVMPQELEKILVDHPGVQEAVVVSRPHEVDGDHPTAIVIKKPGSTVTEKELQDFVATQVPDYKSLRGGVVFVDAVPMTPTGKFRRRALRIMLQNGSL